ASRPGGEPEDDGETCWNNLENFRVKLISVIDPSRITPYLRQCKVINHDDEEQILNDPSLVIRKRKTGLLLDILQRTGQKGFVAFLESLELYYPQLYKKITGNEPTRVFSMIIGKNRSSIRLPWASASCKDWLAAPFQGSPDSWVPSPPSLGSLPPAR
uniref:CARD domain-containing protein n=1 Tax=Varanus komodoensis TaxID=61221 RepID=A0A8D2LTH5_VARKO